MTLQFFRKHRKYLMGLMLLAVFAMVTFGALYYAPDALKRIEFWITGRHPDDLTVLMVYDREVPRSEWQARSRLEGAMRLGAVCDALMRENKRREAFIVGRYLTRGTLVSYYADAFRKEDEEAKNTVIQAALALLHEARAAGVEVTNEMLTDHVRGWQTAGVPDQIINIIIGGVFEGNTYWFYESLRQEMTVSIYLEAVAKGANVLAADVDQRFRQIRESVAASTVVLETKDFLDWAGEPAAEQVAAQFEKYKGRLSPEAQESLRTSPQDETEKSPFGYKIPDRITLKFLKVDAKAIEADVTVTDKDVEEHYETQKDARYVIEEEKKDEQKKEEDKKDEPKEDDGTKATGDGAEAPKAPEKTGPVKTGDDAADEKQPARTLDAPEAPAESAPAASEAEKPTTEPAETQPAQPADAADEAAQSPEKPADPNTAEPGAEPAEPEKKEPPKRYKPLSEVRDEIRRELVRQRVGELAREKAEAAMEMLKKRPALSLENVAADKATKVYRKGPVSRTEAAELKGIGRAMVMISGAQQQFRSFVDLAFSVAPLVEDPDVHLNRPRRILADFEGNLYLFSVTDVSPAHVAGSLDEVRSRVVADLKRVAAYGLVETEAEAILADAQKMAAQDDTGDGDSEEAKDKDTDKTPPKPALDKVAEARKLKANDHAVSFGSLRYDPLAEDILAAAEAGEMFGSIGSRSFDRVTVFQIKEVKRATREDYNRDRDNMAGGTILGAQEVFKMAYGAPEEVIRRSGATRTEASLEWERNR